MAPPEVAPTESIALTIKQVARLLQLPEQTVRQRLREGTLPGVRLGKHWRVSRAGLDRLLTGG